MDGWEWWQRHAADGAVESEQRVALARPVVEFSPAGAERLGRAYWREVQRLTGSLVRARERDGAVELRLLGGPVLLRFDRPTLEADQARAACSYAIAGGLLARRAAGEISFEQTPGSLRSTIRGFFPRVAFYDRLQGRAHVAVSRRYFRRLIAEAGR
ncbi:MAG TPA: hypothetical protein VLD13_02580 [Gaiellaceae bacterium]|nr:hypothetical protein [Gaiellaceae bacterium]